MTARDCFDLPMTGADPEAGAGYDAYVAEFLGYGPNLRDLFAVADASPDAPLINAHAAALHMAFEGAEGWAFAKPYLERMRAAGACANGREKLFCAAVEAWAAKDFFAALASLDELTVRWPADLCAIKWGQYHAFNLGDQAALLRFGQRASVVHEGAPFAHGMIAFALEQNHRLAEAEDHGLRAAEISIDDAWAHHALAHIMDAQGRPREGARWLDHCAHVWDRKGIFIREHNWWHAGLFRLALGRDEDALAIYDERLWGEWPEFPQEQIGAVSMLWRLELRGLHVGERWKPVADQARARAGEHVFPFHDLHYLYALARNDLDTEGFLASMQRHAQSQTGEAGKVWRDIAAPAGEAIVDFAAGRRADAADKLGALLPRLHRIGGSHAQRHVFEETYAACCGEDFGWTPHRAAR